jgi:myo-inositol-1(or 4)-monophosphatase
MPETSNMSARAAATSAISEAGAVLMNLFRSPTGLETWFKEPGELLTAADLRSDRAIRDALTASWPAAIVSEEGERPDAETAWLVDPLCGMFPFSRGMDHWGVNIALRVGSQLTVGALSAPSVGETFVADASGVTRNGEPFTLASAKPTLGESTVLLEGSQGHSFVPNVTAFTWVAEACHVNTLGSCAYGLVQICLGRIGAGVFPSGDPEHNAAGAAVAQQLGLAVTDVDGNVVDWRSAVMPTLVIGRASVVDDLLNAMRRANG